MKPPQRAAKTSQAAACALPRGRCETARGVFGSNRRERRSTASRRLHTAPAGKPHWKTPQ